MSPQRQLPAPAMPPGEAGPRAGDAQQQGPSTGREKEGESAAGKEKPVVVPPRHLPRPTLR